MNDDILESLHSKIIFKPYKNSVSPVFDFRIYFGVKNLSIQTKVKIFWKGIGHNWAWEKATLDLNRPVEKTIDLYRYFDATKQADFLYSCVQKTIKQTIPKEVSYQNGQKQKNLRL